tara:strand:- start:526 stop:1329 length:804 start_codon:yes stop_codon:yes gene_type:complete
MNKGGIMFRKIFVSTLICTVLLGCTTQQNEQPTSVGSSNNQPATSTTSGSSSQSTQSYTKKGVLKYLANNRDVLIEALQAAQQQEIAAREERVKQSHNAIKENFSDVFNRKGSLMVGKLNSPISVVEIYDYNCGYCLKAHNELTKLMAQNKDVRVTYIPVGFLGQKSIELAKLVLAAHQISAEKFTKFSKAMWDQGWNMDKRQRVTVDWVMKNAEKYGYNAKKLMATSKSSAIEKIYDSNVKLTRTIGISGTPSFIIANVNTNRNRH